MANTYLSKTFSSEGNRAKWTWSGWVKKTVTGSRMHLFTSYYNASNFCTLNWESDDELNFYDYNGGAINGQRHLSMKMRDTNAWYHIVATFDSGNSTTEDKMKVWINGTRQTAFESNSAPSGDSRMNHTIPLYIGAYDTSSYFFNGLISHVHFTDGYVYDATAFGSTDSTTGEWQINTSPSVTYGTNGFFILKDGNSVTDQSPNTNNFTVAGGTLTNTEDNPSNVFATGNTLIGRHSNGNYLQPDWSNGNLTATAHGSAWRIFKSTLAASSGKYYAEFKWVSDSNTRYAYVGIYDEDNYANKVSGYPYMGDMANCHAYYSENGQYYGQGNGNSVSFGSAFSSTGDGIVGVAMDLDNSKVYFSSNGSWQGGGDPSNGTGGKSITANKLYSFGLQLYSVGSIVYSANFGNGYFGTTPVSSAGTNASGNGIFEYDVPTGYTALSTKGLNL